MPISTCLLSQLPCSEFRRNIGRTAIQQPWGKTMLLKLPQGTVCNWRSKVWLGCHWDCKFLGPVSSSCVLYFFFAIPISECSVGLKSGTHEIKRPSFPSDVFNMFEYDGPGIIHTHSWCPWIVTETSHPKKLSPGYHLRSRHQFLWEGTVLGSETKIAEKGRQYFAGPGELAVPSGA